MMGFFYFYVLFQYDHQPETDLPSTTYFECFWVPVFFVVPLLTMKSLAEERRHGTLEALLTTPSTTLEIVMGKFCAAYILYAAFWALSLLYPVIAHEYLPIGRTDPRLIEPASLMGGYLFVLVSGLLYIALGIFASSVTRDTLVAGMLGFSLVFALIVSGWLMKDLHLQDSSLAWLQPTLDYFNTFRQLEDFARGIVDTRMFFLYASNTLLVLGLTTLTVEARATA
jgi:ABC-2 type transport system permease protein